MLFFKLSNMLQLQYDNLFKKLQDTYVSKEIYFINSNYLVTFCSPHSICLSLSDGSISEFEQEEIFSDIRDDMLVVVQGDSPAGELMRYIIMRIRAVLKIEPYADPYMLGKLRVKLNEELKNFNIMITDNEELSPLIRLSLNGEEQDVECVVARLMSWNGQTETENETGDFDMQYAKRLMGLMRYEDALGMFLGELSNHAPVSMIYTELCMYIGEIYYHLDDRDKSREYYLRCDTRYIEDLDDYYCRLGHAVLDDGSGLRGGLIKTYYRCMLNPTYKKSIADKYDRLAEQVESIYTEYNNRCIETGRSMCALYE